MDPQEEYRKKARNTRVSLFAHGRSVKWAAEQLKISRQYLHAVFNGKEEREDLLKEIEAMLRSENISAVAF